MKTFVNKNTSIINTNNNKMLRAYTDYKKIKIANVFSLNRDKRPIRTMDLFLVVNYNMNNVQWITFVADILFVV